MHNLLACVEQDRLGVAILQTVLCKYRRSCVTNGHATLGLLSSLPNNKGGAPNLGTGALGAVCQAKL